MNRSSTACFCTALAILQHFATRYYSVAQPTSSHALTAAAKGIRGLKIGCLLKFPDHVSKNLKPSSENELVLHSSALSPINSGSSEVKTSSAPMIANAQPHGTKIVHFFEVIKIHETTKSKVMKKNRKIKRSKQTKKAKELNSVLLTMKDCSTGRKFTDFYSVKTLTTALKFEKQLYPALFVKLISSKDDTTVVKHDDASGVLENPQDMEDGVFLFETRNARFLNYTPRLTAPKKILFKIHSSLLERNTIKRLAPWLPVTIECVAGNHVERLELESQESSEQSHELQVVSPPHELNHEVGAVVPTKEDSLKKSKKNKSNGTSEAFPFAYSVALPEQGEYYVEKIDGKGHGFVGFGWRVKLPLHVQKGDLICLSIPAGIFLHKITF